MKTYTKTSITTEPRLVIEHDENCDSPRKDSNLGYFITVDSRYNSPDKNPELENIVKVSGEEATSGEDHIKLIKAMTAEIIKEKVIAIYSITKYEHSGVSYSLGTVHGFDYSNNGFYIITDKTQKEVGTKKKDFEKAIKNELETYNKWANGENYMFMLYDSKGKQIDACAGFYSVEDIKDYLPKEWKKEDLSDYIK